MMDTFVMPSKTANAKKHFCLERETRLQKEGATQPSPSLQQLPNTVKTITLTCDQTYTQIY